jgi:hypothetical protein
MNKYNLPPKIQKLNIRKVYEEVKNSNLNTKIDKINYLKKYKYIEQDYNFLYNIIVNNDLNNNNSKEIKLLNMMLSKIDDIKDNKITKNKGEQDIGQVLVDYYIKPQIEKSKDNDLKNKK